MKLHAKQYLDSSISFVELSFWTSELHGVEIGGLHCFTRENGVVDWALLCIRIAGNMVLGG